MSRLGFGRLDGVPAAQAPQVVEARAVIEPAGWVRVLHGGRGRRSSIRTFAPSRRGAATTCAAEPADPRGAGSRRVFKERLMAPLLKSLLGNGSKDRELTDEMRAILNEMQQESSRYESLLHRARAPADRLQELAEPVARAVNYPGGGTPHLAELEQPLPPIS